MTSTFPTRSGIAVAILLLASPTVNAQAPDPCTGKIGCADVRSFVAHVTDFRPSVQGRARLITVTLRFQNKLTRPLTLGYVQSSGIITDDEGNRYTVYGSAAVRAIGEVTTSTFDPKFTLQPGEASDARFEFTFQPGTQILGTRYTIELSVREIDPLPGRQFRLGKEHALQFRGFGTMTADAPARGEPEQTPATVTATAPPEIADPCDGRERCYAAGPFVAEVLTLTPSRVGGRHHVLRFNVRFRNVSNQRLVLAYTPRSNVAIDNLGNRYAYGRPSTHDQSVKGMGSVGLRGADASFALRPGESRNATFEVVRFEAREGTIGNEFSFDTALEQLEILPSGQVRSTRQFSVSFPNVREGSSTAAAAIPDGKALIEGLKKKLGKP